MDMTSLLYRSRYATADEVDLKLRSLVSSHKLINSIDERVSFDDFAAATADVVARKYGGDSHDSYITTAMSIVKYFQKDLDIYLASILNGIVMQMNFQTRIFLDGSQSILFDGDQDYFPVTMMHGNNTQGIFFGERQNYVYPAWINASSSVEVNCDRLHFLPAGEIQRYLNANGSNTIGALLVVDPDFSDGAFNISERFAHLNERFTKHTIHCVAGSAEMIFAAAAEMGRQHGEVRVNVKTYSIRSRNAVRHKAVMVFSGLEGLPSIELKPAFSMPCSFNHRVATHPREDVKFVSYASGFADGQESIETNEVIGLWEKTSTRTPFLLSSSAPLPQEAQDRISETFDIYHSLLSINRGILIPSMDPTHSQFMHSTGDGQIFHDYIDDPSRTPFYREAKDGPSGLRHGRLVSNSLIRVKGTAMPLMFTPTLHTWHSHFMIQCLPRVRIARDRDEDITFLVPHDLRKKQLEMLKLLGAGEEHVAFMQRNDFVQADKLYVPCPWRLIFTPYTASVYDEIAANVIYDGPSTPKRILISRESRKSWRNMINYEPIRQMLVEDYGFEVVAPEKMTLAEEVATYANAEIVVGAEGAGMYGAVFSRRGTKYLTLCDEDYVMPILGTIAEIRGLEIGYVFGESFRADGDVARRLPQGHADFTVDIGRVEKAVKRAIAM